MLEVEQLSVRLGGQALLQEINLTIVPGEIAVLVGPNGAGKSTLLKAISGEQRTYEGMIRISGQERRAWKPRALAQILAVMRQTATENFGFTAFELAAIGLAPHGMSGDKPEHREIVLSALNTVGLAGFEDRLVPNLSGGERQRVFLARALVQIEAGRTQDAPRLLALDEPTSALDPAQQGLALRALKRLSTQGVSALVVLHDLTLASLFADRIVLMKEGVILADAPPDTVLTEDLLSECYNCKLSIDHRSHDNVKLVSLGL